MVSSQFRNYMERRTDNTMYSLNFMGQTITCETAGEVVDLVHETGRAATKPTTKPTTTRAATDTTNKEAVGPTWLQKKKARTKKSVLKARAAQAREAYKAKQEASRKAHRDEQKPPSMLSRLEIVTTAEQHHGKKKRADTGTDVIAVLRRSGLALTTTEVYEDLQKAGWKYQGNKPVEAVRGCLNRLVKVGTVAKDKRNGDTTFVIAKVEHDDPLPHEQREND